MQLTNYLRIKRFIKMFSFWFFSKILLLKLNKRHIYFHQLAKILLNLWMKGVEKIVIQFLVFICLWFNCNSIGNLHLLILITHKLFDYFWFLKDLLRKFKLFSMVAIILSFIGHLWKLLHCPIIFQKRVYLKMKNI